MTIEIKWTDEDPETGQKRFVKAEKFAGLWSFAWKLQRRGEWTKGMEVDRDTWVYILDCLERRYRRREGVSDEDIDEVKKLLKTMPVPRDLDSE